MRLATIGYEGLSTNLFFDTLQRSHIELIIDIRELPISRKRGFSKTALSIVSNSLGIDYLHVAKLGSPRDMRHAYRKDRNWDRFSKLYLGYLDTQINNLSALIEIISQKNSCFLCFEADPFRCHRCLVVDRLARIAGPSLEINHLVAKGEPVVVL